MRIVLRENADKIADYSKDELMLWDNFEKLYSSL